MPPNLSARTAPRYNGRRHLERLHERHRAFILDQPILRQDCPHAHVVHPIPRLRIRLLDRLHARLLPLGEPRRDVHPHALGRLGVKRRAVRFALFVLLELLEQRRLRIADHLERTAHVGARFDQRAVGGTAGVGPASELDRLGFLQECRPDVFGRVRGNRGHEQGRGTDPVLDQVGVHADVSGDLAVPIPNVLELVEPILEGVLEGRATGKSEMKGRDRRGPDVRVVVVLGDVDVINDLFFKDAIVVIFGPRPQFGLVFQQVLGSLVSQS